MPRERTVRIVSSAFLLRLGSHRVRPSRPFGVTWIPIDSVQQPLEIADGERRIDTCIGFETKGANHRAGDASDTNRRVTRRLRRVRRRKVVVEDAARVGRRR